MEKRILFFSLKMEINMNSSVYISEKPLVLLLNPVCITLTMTDL